MKRPIVIIAIGYIIGILWGLYLQFSIVPFYILIIIIYHILSCISYKRRPIVWNYFRYIRYIKLYINKRVMIIFILSSIISNFAILYQQNQYDKIQSQLEKQTLVNIIGKITSDHIEKQYKTQYQLKIAKNKYINIQIEKSKDKLEYGQTVRISGKFQIPEESRNYNGFNYNQYLKTQKTVGTVNVNNIEKLEQNENTIEFINKQANKISNLLKKRIQEAIPEKEISGILIAILLGDTNYIPEDIMQNFRTANISHVLAISGMHISYLIILSMFIATKCLGKRKAYCFTILILVSYAFITGFSPSITRAIIMGILVMVSKIIYANSDTLTNIGIAVLCILIANPYTILDIGFQLSFGGTLGIILFKDKIKSVTLSAQIIILPISIFHFNTFNPYFIFSNLLIGLVIKPIMICSFIFIILLFINFQIAKMLTIIPQISIRILLLISQVSKLPYANIYIATPRIWQIILYFIVIIFIIIIQKIYFSKENTVTQKRFKNVFQSYRFYFLYRNPKQTKIIVKVIIIIFITFILFAFLYPNNLKIHFVDVGQGDCTFIETPKGKTILIDGGEDTVLPYILDRGYTNIDFVLVSHFDLDHVGGILNILQEIKISNVIIGKQFESSENYQKFINIVKEKNIKVTLVQAGDRINIEDNIYFDVLWPNMSEKISDNIINNNAMVCKLNYINFTVLFTGDIEEQAENTLIPKYRNNLSATVLKVAHHGSKSSSTQQFLDLVKPKIALIGVGQNNKFGHPSSEVLDRLQNLRNKSL